MQFASELTVAWLSNPNTKAGQDDAAAFLTAMFGIVEKLAAQPSGPVGEDPAADQQLPVSIEQSLASEDFIISLIDGKPYKALRRHLSRHGLTPAEYRQKFGLPDNYPMVAAKYSKERRELANRTWTGRRSEAKRS
nr:MucR family transcriptional regulator [Novosphingobium jiangmenense]